MPPNSPGNRQPPPRPGSGKSPTNSQQITQMVVDQVTERIDAKINQKVLKGQEKVARKTAKHLEQLDKLTAHLEALDVWTRAEPGTRRPRFTRETIAATAIRIADAEGFEAVSMRRIAVELGAGTMTLYHYVRTKDELLALVTDTLMAELVVPADELPADWRGAISAIARRSLEMTTRHPWLLDIADDPNIGPNSVRHFDQSLQSVSSLDASMEAKLDLMTVVDEYVFGFCLHQRTRFHEQSDNGISAELIEYVAELSRTGEYPQLAQLMETYGTHGAWQLINAHSIDTARFERNLARILDGFEASFERDAQRASTEQTSDA